MVRILSGIILFYFLSLSLGSAVPRLTRKNNHSLRLPDSVDASEYITVPAFPGLTFEWPVAMASPAGETNRLFVLEKAGYISVITNLAAPVRSVFLDLTDLASHETQEAGLMGFAFHPGYRTNGFFYIFTTLTNEVQRNCIARFSVDPQNPNKALRSSYTPILFQSDTSVNHKGGDLHFGPDGYLYVSRGDPYLRSQQLYDIFSGIFRIDVDCKSVNRAPNSRSGVTTNYLVPADNPFIGGTSLNGRSINPAQVRTEFWALGLRNPWRFCFDSLTGDLYCADVGEKDWEEVNIIKKGKNYGWGIKEFTNSNDFERPIHAYKHDQGFAVIGGAVYRGTQNPDLFGSYVFGDFSSGRIWALRYKDGIASGVRELSNYPRMICFGTDPRSGDILLASADMTLRRIVRRKTPTIAQIPSLLSETGAFSDLTNLTTHPGIDTFDVTIPFWSDNAEKRRWIMVPASQKIGFEAKENWRIPIGTTFIKHFDLETVVGDPSTKRKIETRFLVITDEGAYGLSYAWDKTQTNAFLVPDGGATNEVLISVNGTNQTQSWIYPNRTQCLTCHTRDSGFALGFNTQQLNCDISIDGNLLNQLDALSEAGYFSASITNRSSLPALASVSNTNNSLEFRARSYLAANCSQCHRGPSVGLGSWDARFDISMANTVNSYNPLPTPSQAVVRHMRGMSQRMPPIATSMIDQRGIDLMDAWLKSIPRSKVKRDSTLPFIGGITLALGFYLWLRSRTKRKMKSTGATIESGLKS
ncbi:MAG: hypothetical protein JWM68_1504 [Verrucomicrobiales bacterium]|nr:hypothetical protein [Verrucomicrobiales bacterium]